MHRKKTAIAAALAFPLMVAPALANADDDRRTVAALDIAYQAAVERNDADAMAAILHKDMILILGTGAVHTGDELVRWARERSIVYERQVEDEGTQTVRLYGDHTAIVTARLWLKGTRDGKPIDLRLWFSDTYVRTPQGWRYALGQASTALPEEK
jgi:ketosteroid isomerase-like protein